MSAHDQEDFYVGYLPQMPAKTSRFLRPWLILAILAPLLIGALIVAGQRGYAPAFFEFGQIRDFEGVIMAKPYPMLAVSRPGEHGTESEVSLYYLVRPFKYGADNLVAGLDGQRVKLSGTLIFREDQTMIEVVPDSVAALGSGAGFSAERVLGSVTLQGEIVDSKCYLGVMNPGDLKPHRACAIRCIAGGIPPVLVVRDGEGKARYFLLAGAQRQPINQEVLDLVAEPVSVTGRLVQLQDRWLIEADRIEEISGAP